MSKTNVDEFMDELNAGILKEKMAHVLSEAALGVVVHGNGRVKAKVSLELTLTRVGENDQVIISHKLSHKTPTKRGFKSEEDTTETPMFVGVGGVMSVTQQPESMDGQGNFPQVSVITPKKQGKNNG